MTDVPICDLEIKHDDGSDEKLSFKLLQNEERKMCMKIIYDSLSRSHEMQLVCDHFELLGMETIANAQKLKYILNYFYAKDATLQLNHIRNFHQFISNLTCNSLQIKYVLSDKQLYKPLILFILSNVSKYDELWYALVKTIPHWKKKHYLFAMRNGLWKSLLYVTESYRERHRHIIIHCYHKQKNGRLFWTALVNHYGYNEDVNSDDCTFQNLRKFYLQFHRYFAKKDEMKIAEAFWNPIKRQYANISRKCSKKVKYKKYFYKQMSLFINWSYYDVEKNILEQDLHRDCAYIPCNKSLCPDRDTFYVCKGCKLVTYCGRNHQKKSWNSLHREQCLRMS